MTADSPSTVYRDPHRPVEERVADLLARMTVDEKAAQLCSRWAGKLEFADDAYRFDPGKAAAAIPHGLGSVARATDYFGNDDDYARRPFRDLENGAEYVNALQRYLVEDTRLGIPALLHDELGHGLLAGEATIFPSAPALGSTWDPDLVEQVFTVAAREARVRGTCLALSPVIDLARDPRWGRVEEMFGEDPHHVAAMAVAAVGGLQGRERPLPADRVYATLKHFIHGTPEGGLNISPAEMSERTLLSRYLVPFKAVVDALEPAFIMPSYNTVNGVPNHANLDLLRRVGREVLGFRGSYAADYDAIQNLFVHHQVVDSLAAAASVALSAGIVIDLPQGSAYSTIPELVRAGGLSMEVLDRAVTELLRLKFEAGLFESPYVSLDRIRATNAAPDHIALARRAATRSIVLLTNDGTLPVEPSGPFRLAVIGPNAVEPLYGGYSGDTGRGVGVLQGIREGAPAGVVVEHAEGLWITAPDANGQHRSYSSSPEIDEAENTGRIAAAVELAGRSDLVILVVGDVPAVTREAVHITLPGDRNSLGLWGRQDELVRAVLDTGTPVVAVMLNGRPLAVTELAARANALVEGWYLGEQGGHALADVVFGRVAPGGKLAVSFPRSVGDLPVAYDRVPSADTNVYLEGERTPLFPFGHGLGYTTFDISAPRLDRDRIAVGESAGVRADVVNTGTRRGDEVVQLYIRDVVSSVARPALELRCFERITLDPGERRTIEFQLTPDHLALWDPSMRWTVEAGAFEIHVGNSSANLRSTTLTVV